MAGVLELETLLVRLTADATQYNRILNDAEKRLSAFATGATQLVTMIQRVTAGVVAAVSVKAFADFDDAMTRSLSKMEQGMERFGGVVRRNLLNMASGSIMSPTDLANAYGVLLRTGTNAQTAMSELAVAERFATANALTAADSATLLSRAMMALGKDSDDAYISLQNFTEISDKLTRASSLSGASVSELAGTVSGRGSAMMKELGLGLDESLAMAAVFARTGYRGSGGSQASFTVLRQIMDASHVTNRVNWDREGIATTDPRTGAMLPLHQIIGRLEDKTRGMSPVQAHNYLGALGLEAGVRGNVLALMGMSKELEEWTKKIQEAGGWTKKVADLLGQDFANQLKIAWNQIKVFSIQVGYVLAPYLAGLVRGLNGLFQGWNNISDAQQRAIVTMVMLATVIRPLTYLFSLLWSLTITPLVNFTVSLYSATVAVVKFAFAVVSLASAIGQFLLANLFKLTYVLLTLPIYVLVDGIAAAVSLLMMIPGLLASIMTTVLPFVAGLLFFIGVAAAVAPLIAALWGRVKDDASQAFDGIKRGAEDAWGTVKDGAEDFVGKTMGFFANFQENMQILWKWFRQNWRTVVGDVLDFFAALGSNLVEDLGIIFQAVGRLAKYYLFDYWRENWDVIVAHVEVTFVNMLSRMWDAFKTWVIGVAEAFAAAMVPGGNLEAKRVATAMQNVSNLKESRRIDRQTVSTFEQAQETVRVYKGIIDDYNAMDPVTRRAVSARKAQIILSETDPRALAGIRQRHMGDPEGHQKELADYFENTKYQGYLRKLKSAQDYVYLHQKEYEDLTGKTPSDFEKGMGRMKSPREVVGDLLGGMKGLLQGFVPRSLLPAFKLDMPEDKTGWAAIMETGVKNALAAREGDVNMLGRGTGVGTTFKQIELARFELNGPGGLSRDAEAGNARRHAEAQEKRDEMIRAIKQGPQRQAGGTGLAVGGVAFMGP